ncbi:MAG: S8 family serine peptidase [Dehalococcoidia bacterium]
MRRKVPVLLQRLLLVVIIACLGAVNRAHAMRGSGGDPALSVAVVRQALINRTAVSLPEALSQPQAGVSALPARYRAGQVLVELQASAAEGTADRLAQEIGGTVRDTMPDLMAFRLGLPDGMSVQRAVEQLQADPDVRRAEANAVYRLAREPSDPLYPYESSYLRTINAPTAWEQQTGDPNVIVAVLDSGVDIDHPDLKGNIWTNPKAGTGDGNNCGADLHGCNFVDGRDIDPTCHGASIAAAPNPDVTPDYWHGTFVAGEIGAQANNASGTAGVAWRISLMPVRVGDCTGPDANSVAQGIVYAARNGARVINMSFGEDPESDDVCHASSQLVTDAVRIAHDRYGAVMVAVSGAGNAPDGFLACVDYPAAYTQVIAVGASAPGDVRAPFSQYGPEVAVAAPGIRIASTTTLRLGQQAPNDLYRIEDGTSFAAPLVAGEAALLISQNHLLTPDLVRSLIQGGAVRLDDAGTPNWAGAGRIDLAASLRLVPAGFYGTIRSLAPVPDGSPVEARIGSALCGTGQTFTVDGNPTYTVFVPPFASMAGCGLPGARVDLTVNGVRGGNAIWRQSDIRLDLTVTP